MNRIPPISRRQQRGAVAIIVAMIFVLVVGAAAVFIIDIGGAEITDASLANGDLRARMLGEAGLERAYRRFKNGTACSAVGPDGPHTFGSGTFTINSGVLEGVNCRVTVTAKSGALSVTMSGVTSPAGPATYSFYEPFPSASDFNAKWSTLVLSSAEGSSGFDTVNCSVAACSGASGGSFRIQTDAANQNDSYAGYRERTIPQLDTSVHGAINFKIAYKKYHQGKAKKQDLEIVLVESSTGRTESIWRNKDKEDDNIWHVETSTENLTGNRVYDKIRIEFLLSEQKFDQVFAWVDEISISAP